MYFIFINLKLFIIIKLTLNIKYMKSKYYYWTSYHIIDVSVIQNNRIQIIVIIIKQASNSSNLVLFEGL
jgi:hypothetical protein